MHSSDEYVQDDNSEDDSSELPKATNKRKRSNKEENGFKKVKYEDILEESEKPKNKNVLHKPPTVEELNNLKETQNLYNNNLFRLQIEELIKEIKIKHKHQIAADKFLDKFKNVIANLPNYTDVKLSEIERIKQKDKFLKELSVNKLNRIITDQDFVLNFTKPDHEIYRFGLDQMDASAGPLLVINVAVTIPIPFLHVKDYTNNRYFSKRDLYLRYIHHFLTKSTICDEISWIFHDNNPLLPILRGKNGKITIKIHPTPPENYFKTFRYYPGTNNIKSNVFKGSNLTNEVFSLNLPTSYYNSTLAYEANLIQNCDYNVSILKNLKNVHEGLKLLQIWQRQRALPISEDVITSLIVYLVVKKRVNHHMSSYQIIRNFWNFIQEDDLSKTALTLNDDVSKEILDQFRAHFDLVLVDRSGSYNILAFLDLNFYAKFKSECEIAFKLLNDDGIHSFQSLFIAKTPTNLQYDAILTVNYTKNIISRATDHNKVKYLGFERLLATREILRPLQRGLNKRALFIVPNYDSSSKQLSFGINFDQNHAFNYLELGPELNDPNEKEFREFWGDLSSDRRFKDGSICVAVYFKTQTIREKREIIRKIINHVMVDKLNLAYTLHYDELDYLIVNQKAKTSFAMGTNEECCLKVISASDELGKLIRKLNLPLAIAGLFNISDSYNFTEVFPPIPTNYKAGKTITDVIDDKIVLVQSKKVSVVPKYVRPIECVIQLEHTSKWPKDLDGLRHMKTAFYLEISKKLPNNIVSSVKPDFIDIFYSGYVFRYWLYVPKEIGLLKKEISPNGSGRVSYKETQESRKLWKKFEILPKITGALKGIQSQYPSYGPSTSLVKRWMRAHLIDDHLFPDLAVHLVNASLFIKKSQLLHSTVPQIGFLRCLKYLSELQWNLQSVVVNFNDEITRENLAAIDSKLLQNRTGLPNLYIATPYDNCESIFTKSSPSSEVLRRVKHLAKETLQCIGEKLTQQSLIDEKGLFIANLDGYDAIIHLRPTLNPRRHEQIANDSLDGQIIFEEYDPEVSTQFPVTDFDPVQFYLRDLRDSYSDFATFFHDSYGGNTIGVLWSPKALADKDFKVSHVNGRKLSDDGKLLILDTDALIEDFFISGQGLVKLIENNTSK